MMNDKYSQEIFALNDEIAKRGGVWELYYQRGYLYFLSDDDEKAKDDYKHAIALGLDPTEYPYYTFSNSNEKRREFLLPEKILAFLVLIIVGIALVFQVASFVLKVKGSL